MMFSLRHQCARNIMIYITATLTFFVTLQATKLEAEWSGNEIGRTVVWNEATTYLYSCCSALADGLWYIGSWWINEGHQAHKTQPSNGKVELCVSYTRWGEWESTLFMSK